MTTVTVTFNPLWIIAAGIAALTVSLVHLAWSIRQERLEYEARLSNRQDPPHDR